MNPVRKLAYRFFSLPYNQIIKIAHELDLIEDKDKAQTEQEKLKAFLKRANEKNILAELWDAVAQCSELNDSSHNPFRA